MAKRSNDEADIEREKAYRRGYAYGIQAMMSVIVDKPSKAERQSFEVLVCRHTDTVVAGRRRYSCAARRTATMFSLGAVQVVSARAVVPPRA